MDKPVLQIQARANLADGRELHGIGQQVVQDLADPDGIAQVDAPRLLADRQVERKAFGVRKRGEGAVSAERQLLQIELAAIQFQLAGLDLRKIEDVVENGEQGCAGSADHLQPLALHL